MRQPSWLLRDDWEEVTAEELPDRMTTSAVLRALAQLEKAVMDLARQVSLLAHPIDLLLRTVRWLAFACGALAITGGFLVWLRW